MNTKAAVYWPVMLLAAVIVISITAIVFVSRDPSAGYDINYDRDYVGANVTRFNDHEARVICWVYIFGDSQAGISCLPYEQVNNSVLQGESGGSR